MGLKHHLGDSNSAAGSEPHYSSCFRCWYSKSKFRRKETDHGNYICKYGELPSDAYITYVIQMHGGRCLLPLALLMTVAFWHARAADPHIDKIERYGTNQNQVLIHFETPANRTTALQATGSLRPPAGWTNVFVVEPAPFPNHYIIFHAPAGRCFYRLRITP